MIWLKIFIKHYSRTEKKITEVIKKRRSVVFRAENKVWLEVLNVASRDTHFFGSIVSPIKKDIDNLHLKGQALLIFDN